MTGFVVTFIVPCSWIKTILERPLYFSRAQTSVNSSGYQNLDSILNNILLDYLDVFKVFKIHV